MRFPQLHEYIIYPIQKALASLFQVKGILACAHLWQINHFDVWFKIDCYLGTLVTRITKQLARSNLLDMLLAGPSLVKIFLCLHRISCLI